jgi:hypothetical protein
MPTPTPHGNTSIKEQPGSPAWSNSEAGYRVHRLYTGHYANLFAFANTLIRGALMSDLGNVVRIYDWSIRHTGKGWAALDVELHGLQQPNPRYTITRGELQQSLYLHKRYNTGPFALSESDKLDIRYWEDEPDYLLKKEFQYKLPNDSTRTLTDPAKDFARKLLKGQDSFLVDAPIVTEVLQSFDEPTTESAHKQETPPTAAHAPSGYVWFKLADDKASDGAIWTRTRQWQGVHTIDGDIYP